MEKKLCVSVKEMGYMLGIGPSIANEIARDLDFPSFYIGRKLLVSVKGLEAWVEQQAGVLSARQSA